MKTIRRVTIHYHQDDESWWADSEDAPGFTAVGETAEEVHRLAREGIRFFLGEDVLVSDDTTPTTLSDGVVSVFAGDTAFRNDARAPLRRPFPRLRPARS